jgi:hypothetical protein
MDGRKPVLTQAQVDECYAWADAFLRDHVRSPRDPCPQCNEADLEPRGGKHVCPRCGYIAPCCDPQE